MKLHVLFTGRTRSLGGKAEGRLTTLYADAIADYAARIGHYVPFAIEELPDLRGTKALTEEQQREREADQVMAALQPGDVLILLDERGRELTSRELAAWLERKMQTVARRLVLLVGGPYGFAPRIYEAAQGSLSLSRLTFSHQMVRLFLVEQLYRACTIIRGEPYHHD